MFFKNNCPLNSFFCSFLFFQNIHAAVEHNAKAVSPSSSDLRRASSVGSSDDVASSGPQSPSESLTSAQSAPLLIFKKLRPPQKSASSQAECIEDPPTLDDDQVAAAARWPSIFNDVDLQQVVNRLKVQIMDACTKCRDACFETRKTVKEVARRRVQKEATRRRNMGTMEDEIDDLGEGIAAAAKPEASVSNASAAGPNSTAVAAMAPSSSFVDTASQLDAAPIEQLEVIGGTLCCRERSP